jgi:diguanylate cyclase (GGDEF)-like protein
MRKILLIDKGHSSIHNFKKSLRSKGLVLIKEQSLKKATLYLENNCIDLIVIDNAFSSSVSNSGRFKKLTSDIPKIILIRGNNLKEKISRHKDRFTISLCEPFSFREFKYTVQTFLKKKSEEEKNKSLQAEIKTIRKELRFCHDIIRDLTSSAELNKILTSLMEKVRIMTGAEACSLLLSDEPFLGIIPLRTSKKIRKFVFKKGVGIAGRVLEKGIPLLVLDATKDKRFDKKVDYFANLNVRSLICAPLTIKDRDLGVLRLINKSNGNSFTDYDMKLLINAANYTAMAIELAYLYEEIKNDELTNLFNGRYLRQAIDMEMERAQRYGSLFSLIFMDIDNFKKVNDKYGHLVGSRVLIEVAQILQENLRKIDIISRYGGDEFVIILPQTPRESGFHVAERLRKVIEKNVFLKDEGHPIRLTASFGVASFPDNARNKEDLLDIADYAMYRGKFSTKNIVFAAK